MFFILQQFHEFFHDDIKQIKLLIKWKTQIEKIDKKSSTNESRSQSNSSMSLI